MVTIPLQRIIILSRGENGWGSNKTSRRELIAKDYRIVMMFGDNFGDFVDINENLLSPKNELKPLKNIKNTGAHPGICLQIQCMEHGKEPSSILITALLGKNWSRRSLMH